ncbi:hypothetical protein F4778DRAFT_734374 [Xylariomycetidae sp. FL2044]|nr:hypothetical protein F4778DRAFT_734374 [Xylariomycetidae sp. FL2044]
MAGDSVSQFPHRLSDTLHTPSQSFSGAAQTPESNAEASLAWADKKFREEYDVAKSRLSDQKFEIADYDDPLLPRTRPQSAHYPKGISAELEKHLLDVVANVRKAMSTSK